MIKMEVLSDKCKGCGLCTTACPKKNCGYSERCKK